MVDYTQFYFKNYGGESNRKPKTKLRKRSMRGIRVGIMLIVVSFIVTLTSLNAILGGLVVGKPVGDSHVYYARVIKGFENIQMAEKYAASDRARGGAGIVIDGQEIVVFSAVYDSRSTAHVELLEGQEVMDMVLDESASQQYLDVLDEAFTWLLSVCSLGGCGADEQVFSHAVRICSYQITSRLEGVQIGSGDAESVQALKSGLNRLNESPCVSNAMATLVSSVLPLYGGRLV